MGTETKLNCYTENTSTGSCSNNGICIPKVQLKGSNGSHSIPPQQPKQQQQAQCIYSNGHVVNGKDKDVLNGTVANSIVPFIPLHIDEHHVIDGAKEILKVIRPHWNLQEVHFKIFTNGITNKLVGCFYKQPSTPTKTVNGNSSDSGSTANGHSAHTRNGATAHCYDDINDAGNLSDSDTDSDTAATATAATAAASTEPSNNVVLVRVYGNKTDLLIDRKAETRNILLLHSYGFAPSLYATFKNGLAYDYVPGVTLNTSNILLPEVWGLVARRMADMHRMVQCKTNGDQPPVPMLWKKTQSFMDLVPEQFSDPAKQQRVEGTFLPISRMRQEFAALYSQLETLGSPLVFAHNDLLLGNLVYTESLQSVNFIDYEYADFNFQAFDIGNHFAEFAGVDEVDYSRYPARDFQLEWLRIYLETYLQRTQISEAEVQRLYVQVNQFALAAHFFWTIWSLIQAEHSTIDFDYINYAFLRYNEYLARKDEILALEMQPSSDSS